MKNRIFFLCSFCLFCSLLMSTIWEIKQDGTGNFTTIQEGINIAIDADTVLVYPGTYYENVDFLSKSIILGSLYLTTGNEEYVSQTIINGNQSGSCVEIRNCVENYTTICGLTLTNGSGNYWSQTYLRYVGGGILVHSSNINILSCYIHNNISADGGGIFCFSSQINISNTKVSNNKASRLGGGIVILSNSEIYFDEINLCNIYLNFSEKGSEIYKHSDCLPAEVFVDTFTVLNPDNYFLGCWNSVGIPINDIVLNVQTAILVPIDADLYVAPDGDNSNSGLTPNESLATINYAYSMIQPDSLQNNTIYLADGVYSTTLNDQWFPLQMRGLINLVGESMENTVLDAEDNSSLITDRYSIFNYKISNLNLVNGNCVHGQGTGANWILCFEDPLFRDQKVQLDNLYIHNCIGNTRLLAFWWVSASIENIHFYDNTGPISSIDARVNNLELNFKITNFSEKNSHTSGMGFYEGFDLEEKTPVILNNVEITDNLNPDGSWPESTCGVSFRDNFQVDMINCTLGVNAISSTQGGPINLRGAGTELNIYNSILYGNYPRNIWIGNENEDYPNVVNIYNSLVEDGEDSCFSLYPWDEINFIENNLIGDTDPLWIDSGDYPFQLSTGSPCIDAGTLNLPAGIELPEFDLAGFPRIYGNTIDMGAYEWQGVEADEDIITPITQTQISNYPNPFNSSTTIKLELAEPGKIEFSIYNIKGQKVKTLIDAYSTKGVFEAIWNGRDSNNKCVSSGEYIVKLKLNGEIIVVHKMTLLK